MPVYIVNLLENYIVSNISQIHNINLEHYKHINFHFFGCINFHYYKIHSLKEGNVGGKQGAKLLQYAEKYKLLKDEMAFTFFDYYYKVFGPNFIYSDDENWRGHVFKIMQQ